MAVAAQKPATVDLQIERSAKPYDRAAKGGPFTIAPGKWTELHVTFTVEKDFPQGWFAYISCEQPNCEFRADMFNVTNHCNFKYWEVGNEVGGFWEWDWNTNAPFKAQLEIARQRRASRPTLPATTRTASWGSMKQRDIGGQSKAGGRRKRRCPSRFRP